MTVVVIIFCCIMIFILGMLLGFVGGKFYMWIIPGVVLLGAFMAYLAGETRYAFKVRAGVLDWDLYENGILTKKWNPMGRMPEDVHVMNDTSSAGIRQLDERFFRFDAISKVHLTEAATQKDECVRLFVRLHNSDPGSMGPRIKDEKSPEWEAARIWAGKSVLFEGREGRLLFDPIERKNFKDLQAFENVIRQKVKSVE